MFYKLVVMDIDGTIRTPEKPVSSRLIRAIEHLLDVENVIVTIATGRTHQSTVNAIKELDIKAPIIVHQGTRIVDPNTNTGIWRKPMTEIMVLEAIDALKSWQGEIMAYCDKQIYTNKLTPWVKSYGNRNHIDIKLVRDLKQIGNNGILRVVAVGKDNDVIRLITQIKTVYKSTLRVTRSLPIFCEILHPEAGKDMALAWLTEYLDIKQNQTIAIGNGPDDISMLRWAGLGIAIKGSQSKVIESADIIADCVENDGAAQILENLTKQRLVTALQKTRSPLP